jgi:hypothetical protein
MVTVGGDGWADRAVTGDPDDAIRGGVRQYRRKVNVRYCDIGCLTQHVVNKSSKGGYTASASVPAKQFGAVDVKDGYVGPSAASSLFIPKGISHTLSQRSRIFQAFSTISKKS